MYWISEILNCLWEIIYPDHLVTDGRETLLKVIHLIATDSWCWTQNKERNLRLPTKRLAPKRLSFCHIIASHICLHCTENSILENPRAWFRHCTLQTQESFGKQWSRYNKSFFSILLHPLLDIHLHISKPWSTCCPARTARSWQISETGRIRVDVQQPGGPWWRIHTNIPALNGIRTSYTAQLPRY